MRVLIPTLTRPHLGGAHTLLRATGRGLERRGHEVLHVSLFGVGEEPALRLDLVKRSDRALSAGRPRSLRTFLLYHAARRALAAKIDEVLCRHGPFDAAFTIDAGATQALWSLRPAWPLHCVFDVAGRLVLDLEGQGKIARGGWASRRFLREERLAYERAGVTLAYPPSFAEELRRVAPAARIETTSTAILDVERIRPVHDEKERARARESFGLPAGVVLFAPSRLVARKGVVEAVGVLQELGRRGIEDAQLVLAGEGPEEARVWARARALGVEDRVHVLGGVAPERMSDAYAAADLVLLPAVPALGYEEPQGLTTFEALAAERPVVASRLGGIPEVIRDGETGLLCAAGDESAFAEAIVRLREEPGLAERLVAGGRAELARRLANDAHFERIERLLSGSKKI